MIRTCLITGTTHGMGQVTARAIAAAGYTVVMANRDSERAARVATDLQRATGNERISTLHCDLASLASVRACAAEFLDRHEHLDVLINNAGIITAQPQLSADGIELTFAVNHLGGFLLTQLLLESLRAAPQARVINLASSMHRIGRLDLDRLTPDSHYSWPRAYARSKLATVMTTITLARRLADTQITVNCLHPGIVASNIVPRNSPLLHRAGKLVKRLMHTAERGAATPIWLALADDLSGVTGKYFNGNRCVVAPAPRAQDVVAQERLWQVSMKLAGVAQEDGKSPP